MAAMDDRSAVRRLFDRFGFGPRPGDLDTAVARGFTATAAALIDPAAAATDPGVLATPPPDLGPQPAQPANKKDTAAKKAYGQRLDAQRATLTTWWLDRMVAAGNPFTERLTWFWHGHYATSDQKVRSPRLMQRQNDTFRQLGSGSFTALARAMIVDPALMVWLDAQDNKVGAANENLARESMELFMLGIGHYTETDVRQAARALTGWVVNRDTMMPRFVPKRHDNGTKTVLGTTGNLDADSFVNTVLGQPASAPYVVGRLWFRLVSATPPPPDVLGRLVAAYGPNRDILATVRAMAAEPAFTDSAQTLVKQPVEWAVGLMRALAVRPSKLPAKEAAQLVNGLRNLGQVPFLPPNVGGWPSGTAWLTTSSALSRLSLARLIIANADLSAIDSASTANRIDAVGSVLGVDSWTARTRSALADVAGDSPTLVSVAACAPEYVVSL